jgi:hypothetical protein
MEPEWQQSKRQKSSQPSGNCATVILPGTRRWEGGYRSGVKQGFECKLA